MRELSSYGEEKDVSTTIKELQAVNDKLLKTLEENTELKIQIEVLFERRRWLFEIDRLTKEANRNAREVAALLVAHHKRKVQDAVRNERQRWIRLLETGYLGWLRDPRQRRKQRHRDERD